MKSAVVTGLVSAVAVSAIFFAAGVFDDEPGHPAAGEPSTTTATGASLGEVYRRVAVPATGGPLLDAAGRVIGVVTQGRGEGIAFAVPADAVKSVAERLRRRERARG